MDFADAPAAAMLGTVDGDPNTGPAPWMMGMWSDPITENPAIGATEVWEFYNGTVDAHPMHIHEVVFEVLNRQAIFVNEDRPRPFRSFPDPVPTAATSPGRPVTRIRLSRSPARSRACERSSSPPASSSGTATSSSTRITR